MQDGRGNLCGCQLLVVFAEWKVNTWAIVGLGWWLGVSYERDCSQGVPHESQTTNPNQQLTISRGKEDDFCLIFKWICLDSRSKNCKLCPTNFTKPKILSSFFLDAFCKQQIELTNGASDSRKSNLMMDDFGQTHDLLFLLSILKTGQTQLNWTDGTQKLKHFGSMFLLFLFWGGIFRFHVSFQGCTSNSSFSNFDFVQINNQTFTPWKFNSSPLKIGRVPKGSRIVFQSSIFQGRAVSFR